ncbi:DUF6313 family protein [Actinomadura sp. DC4]|uniref:DUF6313 family protein n=1 Tax=Actinomadura sp. DC4 TaxID=3055069 RepID=UPI0025B00F0D|nr:DUF6313 family protein [Actinomadura sp. DC4]MDN3354199.1 DUF6313 family protein [Actinomadura sp. DC4]
MAAPPEGSADGVDLPPPPREPYRHSLRRWRLSLERYHGLRYWALTRGLPLLMTYVGLFVASGFAIGWRRAYDVSIGITSPAGSRVPVLAWFLSVAGWLLVPAVVGGIAGYVVSDAITSRRTGSAEEIFTRDDDE